MQMGINLNIDMIYTIIYKKEPPGFRWENPGREWDGFVLFTGGTAEFTAGGRETAPCVKGTLLLLRKDEPYTIFSREGCAYVTSAFDFSPYCSDALLQLPKSAVCPENQYAAVVYMAKKWQRQQWDSQLSCRIGLLELYTDLLRCYVQPAQQIPDSTVRAAIEYLHRHFKRNFSASEIAAHCNISPSYLRTRFRVCTGMTITAYRNDLRINAAKEMLQSGLFTVKEAALELGYCDVYYFSKCFAAETGVTPAKFANTKSNPNKPVQT